MHIASYPFSFPLEKYISGFVLRVVHVEDNVHLIVSRSEHPANWRVEIAFA